MLSKNCLSKILTVSLVFCCPGVVAHKNKRLPERFYPFKEKMYDLCNGHGEEHMTENQINLLLKEVEDNHSHMMNLIDLAESERFLVRLTNVVIVSDLPLTKKNEFYKRSYIKSKENGEEWSDVIKLLIDKTSSLKREDVEGYATSSNQYLRAAANKALKKRSSREDIISPQLKKDKDIEVEKIVEEKQNRNTWIIIGILAMGILTIFFKILKGKSTS